MKYLLNFIPSGWTPGAVSKRSALVLDVSLITLFGGIITFLLLTAQKPDDFIINDYLWYMNRADLIWNGVFGQFFVYTFTYPFLVGAVDILVGDLVTSSIIVVLLAIDGLLIGVYLLGRIAYNRSTALLAVMLLISNVSMYVPIREMQTYPVFLCLSIWCLLTAYYAAKHPNVLSGSLLGVIITLGVYARFEGIQFGLLIPFVMLIIYRQTGSWKKALQVGIISGLIAGISTLFYLYNLASKITDPRTTGVSNFFGLFLTVPPQTRLLSWRFSDLMSFTVDYWPVWAWILLFFAITQWKDPSRRYTIFTLMLLVYSLVIVLVVTPWPSEHKNLLAVPYTTLLLAWALIRLEQRWRIAAFIAIMLLIIPGTLHVVRYMNGAELFAYRHDPKADWNADLEAWVDEIGQEDAVIYTLCGDLAPYTRTNMRQIYRLGLVPISDPSQPNSPSHVIPELAENDGYLMTCSSLIFFGDWGTYLTGKNIPHSAPNYLDHPVISNEFLNAYDLELANQIGPYSFYRVATHAD